LDSWLLTFSLQLVIAASRAGSAQHPIAHDDFAPVINALAASITRDPKTGPAWQVLGSKINPYALHGEQIVVRHHLVGLELLAIRTPALRKHGLGLEARVVSRDDPDGSFRLEIDEGGSHLAIVDVLQGSQAETTACHQAYGIRGTAVDLHKRQQPLGVSLRILNADRPQAQHGHAHTQDLTGTQVFVTLSGEGEVFLQGLHAFDYTLRRIG
jgi:hypothetical protein